MKALVTRRPSFPIGTEFLSLWRIERILYCRDQFECYLAKKIKRLLLELSYDAMMRQSMSNIAKYTYHGGRFRERIS